MAGLKTKQNDADVHEFIKTFADTEQKRQDSFKLLEILEQTSGYKAKMWWPTIIGFGSYHYKSEKSRQEGDRPLVGFSPRKAAISLYIYSGYLDDDMALSQDQQLTKFGKLKMGKGCIYIKKLSDIDIDILKKMVQWTIAFLQAKYPTN